METLFRVHFDTVEIAGNVALLKLLYLLWVLKVIGLFVLPHELDGFNPCLNPKSQKKSQKTIININLSLQNVMECVLKARGFFLPLKGFRQILSTCSNTLHFWNIFGLSL